MSKPRVEPRTYSRSKRRMQIMNIFKIAAQHEDFQPKTIAQVGHQIGLPASTHLRDILREMAEAGELVESWRDEPGKLGAAVFALNPAYYHGLFSRRHIRVNKRGVVVGQLEMAL